MSKCESAISIVCSYHLRYLSMQIEPDMSDRMPIFTPAFPSKCVTHTVTRSTQTVLITEFEKGRLLFGRIFLL